MIPWLSDKPLFPPVNTALTDPNGLLAVGGDLSPRRLLAAYRQGIFPWYSPGDPILWWSPDPRMVLVPDDLRITRSLAKTLRNTDYQVRLDTRFAEVVAACANAPRAGQNGTWITGEMQAAYRGLHAIGHAHSVETWIDGELAGGLYCVSIGRMVFGESMFARRTDASKIALSALVAFCRMHEVPVIDCQQNTRHLASLGAFEVPRELFERMLTLGLGGGDIRDWSYDPRHWATLGLAD